MERVESSMNSMDERSTFQIDEVVSTWAIGNGLTSRDKADNEVVARDDALIQRYINCLRLRCVTVAYLPLRV